MDFSRIIEAIATKSTGGELVLVLVVGVLVYLLREERQERRETAQAMIAAMEKTTEALNRVGELLTELRIAVAKGDK